MLAQSRKEGAIKDVHKKGESVIQILKLTRSLSFENFASGPLHQEILPEASLRDQAP